MAGLSANGPLTVVEPHASRDHTERMFRMLGVPIEEWTEPDGAHGVSLSGPIDALPAFDFDLPSDPSSAAFIAGAAAIVPGSLVTIPHVCLNPGRVGFFSVLEDMGAAVMFTKEDERAGEPVGTVRIAYAPLRGTSIGGKTVPAMIDEFPILAVVATQAQGAVRVRDARELRYKESNRIEALARELNKMGAGMEPTEDGFVIKGPVKLKGAKVHAGGDHRLAMSLAVAGFIAEGSTLIEGAHAVDDSFPGFAETFRGLGATIDDHRIDISHGHNREPYGAQP
jgi:3-phosphoshikimate 1-carboxyvinyltransferase